MKIKVIDFYYFSGTGNTLTVVNTMARVFQENDIRVNIYRIEKTNPQEINLNNTIGIAFPVAEQGTYPFVWNFINKLPKANGTNIFIVDTLMAFSGGIIGPVKKIVQKKGYKAIGAKEIPMPNNLFPKKIISKKNENKVNKGKEIAVKYAHDILQAKSKWNRVPILSDIMSAVSQSPKSWNLLRKHFSLEIDESKCVKCGRCIKLCPVENISMEKYPKFKDKCTLCMRCISFCPKEAIYIPKKNYERYTAVKVTDLLK